QVVEQYNAKDYDKARATLEPILARHTEHPTISVLACDLASRRANAAVNDVEPVCARAARVAPEDPLPPLKLAEAYMGAKQDEKAAAAMALARERLAASPDAPGRPGAWHMLAGLYQHTHSPTWARQAARRAGPAASAILTWADLTERRFAIPKDA